MSFSFPIRVYWEDTDAGGIVFYANYLKFFERARTEWLRSMGFDQSSLVKETGGMFIVSQTAVKYLQPARLDDELFVTAELQRAGAASLIIAQQAFLRRRPTDVSAGGDKALLCEGTIRIAWVDEATLKPAKIPSAILEALNR